MFAIAGTGIPLDADCWIGADQPNNYWLLIMNMLAIMLTLFSKQPDIKGKVMLLGGMFLHPIQTRRWFRFLASNDLMWTLAQSYPRLRLKIYRPFMSQQFSCADRVDTLIHHYRMILQLGFGDLIRQLAIHSHTLCEFSGKSGEHYRLDISCLNLDTREGEIFLHLVTKDVSIYRASFIFIVIKGKAYVKIGCVQGVRAVDGAYQIRSVTRDLYGCRPKNLMVSVIRDIGDYFGCQGMIGISNDNRIVSKCEHKEQVSYDYNNLWQELDATRKEDGNFHLSCSNILKNTFDDIPSNKRSAAKKRNSLLESIFQAVRSNLDVVRARVGTDYHQANRSEKRTPTDTVQAR